MHLTITSSAQNAAKYVEGCLRSVHEQSHKNWTHYYVVDKTSTDFTHDLAKAHQYMWSDSRIVVSYGRADRLRPLDNLLPIWRSLPPEEVIVWLDGDDALLIPRALEIVNLAHEKGAWVTWGQFVWSTGELGFAGPVGPCPRREDWHATHLKTFRAGLVQRIDPAHLQDDGHARDMAVMFPCLEMAAERGVFIDRLLYLYNVENSFQAHASAADKQAEAEAVRRIRNYPRYKRLERL